MSLILYELCVLVCLYQVQLLVDTVHQFFLTYLIIYEVFFIAHARQAFQVPIFIYSLRIHASRGRGVITSVMLSIKVLLK